jgi:hypothetical protein
MESGADPSEGFEAAFAPKNEWVGYFLSIALGSASLRHAMYLEVFELYGLPSMTGNDKVLLLDDYRR